MDIPYQEKIINDESERILCMMGRITGKTTIAIKKAFKLAESGLNVLIIEPSARECLVAVRRMRIMSTDVFESNHFCVTTKNQAKIYVLPAKSKSLRGYSVNYVIIDDVPHNIIQKVYSVALISIAALNGRLMILSRGVKIPKKPQPEPLVYRLWKSGKYATYRVATQENPLIDQKFPDEVREHIGEMHYSLEYTAEFVNEE